MNHEDLFSHKKKLCGCIAPKEIQKAQKEIIKEMRAKAKELKKTGWKNDGIVERYISIINRKY